MEINNNFKNFHPMMTLLLLEYPLHPPYLLVLNLANDFVILTNVSKILLDLIFKSNFDESNRFT